jgi:hypothetical protein
MKKLSFLLIFIMIAGCKKPEVLSTNNDVQLPDVAQHMPVALPHHVGFGTEGDISHSDQFIRETDYQYQYLSGDIFSTNGWTSWNAPTGDFARTFLSKVSSMGKIPVFTYYNLVPAKNRGEDPPLTNLNDAEVMYKYFEDWKFLLTICGRFGGTVIIHYEPDLLGYMEVFKNDPSKSTIKVSQSNYPDAASFTNDAGGLCQAIISMRNKYAPNVLLGWHASQWATGKNLVKDKHDPEQLAIETAVYYQSLNAPFDLIFSEFTDRDAGYNSLVYGNNTTWSVTANTANGNLSDFDRFQRFLKKLNRVTGQKILLWQIPIGNSVTKTCNNTPGHYTDNKAEYFLQPVLAANGSDKIAQYADAGVIGFLFGRGSAACTSYADSKADGITAPGETTDDDGGYLRKAIKAYYQHGTVAVQ